MIYTLDITVTDAMLLDSVLKVRIEKLELRLKKNPNTPNKRHVEKELATLLRLHVQCEEIIDRHFAKIKEHLAK